MLAWQLWMRNLVGYTELAFHSNASKNKREREKKNNI